MEFRLLGPIEVVADGGPLPLGGRQRRTVLAILLVNAGSPVSTDRLIDEIWGEAPPDAARKSVQAHVAHLRRSLNLEGEVLSAGNDGYVLDVEYEQIDSRRFESLVDEARPYLTREPDRAATLLGDALDLFRGSPFSGIADDAFSLRVEASRLEEVRLAAIEDRFEAMLASGNDTQVLTEAGRLVEQHPLRERLWALLMIGLYRARRQSEALRAFSRVRQILAEELGVEPSSELQALEQRILEHDPTLAMPTPIDVVSTQEASPSVRNPFKGLRAFDEADAADFFGREDLVRRLYERLDRRGTANSLVVLAGPSGAGKSSAVRAGLIPLLREEDRDTAVMFPGGDPVGELRRAVAEATGQSPDVVQGRIEASQPLAGRPLIVVVDQCEELFTITKPEVMERFLEILTGDDRLVKWLITVRADFLDRMLTHPALGARLDGAVVLVPPMQEHEVRTAVTGPAGRVGVSVEPDLVSEVVKDVRARPAALPLLQYALTDTFERRGGDRLTLADYRSAGGISGALSRRADELYESLDRDQQESMKQVLLTLVTVTDDGEGVRRRVDRESLLSLPSADERLAAVIERLGGQRLLTFDQSPETGRATVEVAHEALISEWPRLTDWVEHSRDDLRLRQRMSTASGEWEESGRDTGFLLTGSRLEQFSEWAHRTDLELTALHKEYLKSSLTAQEARVRRTNRSRRLVVGGVVAGVLVATGLGVFALSQRQATEEQERIVAVGDLAAAATDNLAIDPELSILLAMEAVETTRRVDGTVLAVAEEALHRAVLSNRLLGRVGHNGPGIAHFSPDGSRFVTAGEDPTTVQVWSVEPFEHQLTLVGHTDQPIDAVFDKSDSRLATAAFDGTVRIWDAANGELELTLDAQGPPLLIPAFSNDGSMVAATSLDGTTRIWDLDTEMVTVLKALEGTFLTLNLEFSRDDSLLAVIRQAMTGASTLIYDVGTGELVRTLETDFSMTDLGFTPDGEHIVTADGEASTATIWDVETGEMIATYFGHDGPVQDLQISQDGTRVASSGVVDVRVWDLNTRETLATIVGHSGIVDGIDINLDRGLLLTSSEIDKTTRLWDLTPYWSHELVGLPGPTGFLGSVTYSPDGKLLAASRDGDKVTVWSPHNGQEVKTFEDLGFTLRMTMDQEGSVLVTAGVTGVKVHDLRGDGEPASLVGVWSNGVAFGPGRVLAASTDDGIRLWDSVPDGKAEPLSEVRGTGVTFDPRGELIAYGVEEQPESEERHYVEIRDLETNGLVSTLRGHTGVIRGIAFDHEGKLLATASADTTAVIWDVDTFESLHRLEVHTSDVFDIAFHPERAELATAGADNSVRIWDTETGTLLLTLPAQSAISDLDYSPDGRYLAAVSPGGFVTVFMLNIDELVGKAQERLTRWWTEAECKQYLDPGECPPAPERLSD